MNVSSANAVTGGGVSEMIQRTGGGGGSGEMKGSDM